MADRRNRHVPRAGSRPGDTVDRTTVKLRPVAGIPPATWVPVLHGVGLLLVLFLLLVLPGLRFNGSLVTFSSSPAGARVEVDGRFVGNTPATTRLAAGTRRVTLTRTWFQAHETVFEVRGRLLLSLIAPRRAAFHASLQLGDPEAAVDAALLELARSPRLVRIITEAADDLAGPPPQPEAAQRFLHNALYLVEDSAGVAALFGAQVRFAAVGGPVSPLALQQAVRQLARGAAEYPTWPLWIGALLPAADTRLLLESASFAAFVERQARAAAPDTVEGEPAAAGPSARAVIEVVGLRFHSIPGGTYVMGDAARFGGAVLPAQPFEEWPHPVTVGSFYIQEREVTKEAYARFVAAVPAWAVANRAALVVDGLVAEDYLADWVDGRPPIGREREPVVYVSAPAAEAFAAWLSERLPPAAAGRRLRARLPFEPEWEYAARGGLVGQPYPRGAQSEGAHVAAPGVGLLPVGRSPTNGYGLRDLLGSVWEWTGDWYSPARYLLARDFVTDYRTDPRFRVGSRRVVRGGSFTNDPRVVKLHTRGSQPADWCTPVLGFRLVLAEP